MPLSSAEREAREAELLAKRQKKDEEKLRILRQAQEDRKSYAEDFVPAVAVQQATAQETAATATPEPVKNRGLRLQVRCPHWQKTMQFTTFTSESSLDDVRAAVREEILSGASAQEAERVPPREDITLVETVPPRRRFKDADSVKQTLQQIGLVSGSVSLLAEAPPLPKPEPPPAPHSGPVAGDDNDAGVAEEGEDDEEDEELGSGEEDDGASDHGSDDTDSGDDDPGFSGGFPGMFPPGKGGGRGFPPFGGGKGMPRPFPGRGRGFGPQGHVFPEGGGQVLGSREDGGPAPLPGGQGAVAAADADLKSQREARLAALEKRMGAAAAASSSSSTAAAAGGEAAATPGTSSTSAAEASSAPAAKTAQQVKTRVPGMMGGGVNKDARAREREEILQRMKEDRERYVERAVAASSSITLDIQDAEYGRLLLRRTFPSSDTLQVVRDAAAAELGQEAHAVSIATSTAPSTEFITAEDLSTTLGELSLGSGARLLAKKRRIDDGSAAAVSSQAAAAPDVASQQPQAAPQHEELLCIAGHAMPIVAPEEDGWCDKCKISLPTGGERWCCEPCLMVLCVPCARSLAT